MLMSDGYLTDGGRQSARDCTAEVCHWEVTEVTCRRSAGTRWSRRRHHDNGAAADAGRRTALVRIEFVLHVSSSTTSGENVLARDSMLSTLYAIANPSVRPSICLSVTRVDQSKTVELRVVQFSPYSSPISLLFACKFHPEIPTGSPRARASN